MSRYDRSWTVAMGAVALGLVIGFGMLGAPGLGLGSRDTPTVRPSDGIRGPLAPPRRPPPPTTYRPPMVLSNSGTHKALEKLKRSDDPAERAGAAGILSLSVEPERVLTPLTYALENDEDVFVRVVSAQSIGRLGARQGLEPLTRAATSDPSPRVRAMAAEAHDSLLARIPAKREDGG